MRIIIMMFLGGADSCFWGGRGSKGGLGGGVKNGFLSLLPFHFIFISI